MARKHEAVELMKSGLSPSEIAESMGISVKSIEGYLYNQVGEGRIKRSDIVFSIKENLRIEIEKTIKQYGSVDSVKIFIALSKRKIIYDKDEILIYLKLRDARIALGDLYELIYYIETKLHVNIKEILITEFGEIEWWEKGIPEKVREDCLVRYEKEKHQGKDSYSYTTLINLKKILEKKWDVFIKYIPDNLISNKKILLSHLDRLNSIRNNVMHPVKGNNPTETDFLFVRDLYEFFKLDEWMK